MEQRQVPRKITSKKQIQYRPSSWGVHQFEVISGEVVCLATALRLRDSLLLWVGAPGGPPQLGQVALGVPPRPPAPAAATALTAAAGPDGLAPGLARRLAAALARPVYVCCAATFDRFTLPLVEHGLITAIKSRPENF